MIFWLDWRLFGNGWGLASPHFDDVFYWLSGRFYHWIGGLGAQLASFEWTTPKPGTRRQLIGREFVVFNVTRHGPRVMVSWAHVPDLSIDGVRALKRSLQEWGHGV